MEIENEINVLRSKLNKLLNCEPKTFEKPIIDVKIGVYAIYDNDGLLYIGQSSRLKRRLLSDHRTGNIRGSAFRRSLSKYKEFDEEDISEYILKHCKFQYINEDDRHRLEHFNCSS